MKKTILLLSLFLLGASDPEFAHMRRLFLSEEAVLQKQAAQFYEQQAKEGVAEGEYWYGRCLTDGIGVTADPVTGVSMYRRAAGKGHADAMARLAMAYKEGEYLAKDERRYIELMRQAAEAGSLLARMSLAHNLMTGEYLPRDPKEALTWWRKAASTGFPLARLELALLLASGEGGEQDVDFALAELKDLTHSDFKEAVDRARRMVWLIYYLGLYGIPKDRGQAIEWFLPLAEDGDFRAMELVGHSLLTGLHHGLPLSTHAKAAYWLSRPGEKMSNEARLAMGFLSLFDSSGSHYPNLEGALKWFDTVPDQEEVGQILLEQARYFREVHTGVKSSVIRSMYRLSAEKGHPQAALLLGDMALLGWTMPV
ncbi:MAG: sel1 repeat family protein, partial [Magnetococcales bacterium]|nr:sel1 repeat family protein [Magnetococcales bacterium]